MNNFDVKLSKERWEKIYSEDDNKNNYKKDPIVLSYKKFLDRYKSFYKKGIFLDLGCGVAYVAGLLAKEGVCVLGVDISSNAIKASSELFKREKLKGDFVQADLLNLPLKTDSISFIYSCMSLEYVKDTQKAIDEAYRVLKPDGRMIAILPVISLTTLTYHQLRGDIPHLPFIKHLFEWMHIKILKGKYMHYGYEQSFTSSYLKEMFSNAGFKINIINYFDMYYPIAFIPKFIRPYVQKILKYRPFWPLAYVEAIKI
ncbi:MAG: class I SAM-dependent methyltransferase [Candidatus Levybacteria bacterium]|nr:class I SAM-dependent methyltransferase [Candidatus Levybacteria bacterium]